MFYTQQLISERTIRKCISEQLDMFGFDYHTVFVSSSCNKASILLDDFSENSFFYTLFKKRLEDILSNFGVKEVTLSFLDKK